MEVEKLDLDDFDLDTHEPPNYNTETLSIERINDNEEDYSEDEEDYTDEELEYTDDEGEDLEIAIDNDNTQADIDFEDSDNVIYSYPFFTQDGIDYEYRVTITDEELLLEQVKCDDNQTDFNECVDVFAEIYRGELIPTFELIQNNLDLRDKSTVLQEGIIDYNFDSCKENKEELKKKIENNKQSVLFELYKEIVDSVYQ